MEGLDVLSVRGTEGLVVGNRGRPSMDIAEVPRIAYALSVSAVLDIAENSLEISHEED